MGGVRCCSAAVNPRNVRDNKALIGCSARLVYFPTFYQFRVRKSFLSPLFLSPLEPNCFYVDSQLPTTVLSGEN